MIQKAIDIASKDRGGRHPYVAEALVQLGPTLYQLGYTERALAVLTRAREIFVETYGSRHPALAEVYAQLAPVLINIGEPDQADELIREAQTIRAQAGRPGPE